jgi:hypothetical protein
MRTSTSKFLITIRHTLDHVFIGEMSVFSALAINRVYKITRFQFRVGLTNKNTEDLSWFRPLGGGNSPTFSGLILIKTGITEGEQRARLVCT